MASMEIITPIGFPRDRICPEKKDFQREKDP